jgi:threonine dehydrogenase-like Zn-dependent dehydrogenase
VDVAIEASGNPAALQACIDAAAFAGTVVVASWYGTRDASLNLGGRFHRRRTRIVSSQVSTLDPALGPRWDRARRSSLVSELLQELPLDQLITHRFPLDQAAAAYELLDRGPGDCLQVVLDYV